MDPRGSRSSRPLRRPHETRCNTRARTWAEVSPLPIRCWCELTRRSRIKSQVMTLRSRDADTESERRDTIHRTSWLESKSSLVEDGVQIKRFRLHRSDSVPSAPATCWSPSSTAKATTRPLCSFKWEIMERVRMSQMRTSPRRSDNTHARPYGFPHAIYISHLQNNCTHV